jgi:two-component system CheB/CheR fusion protein
MSKKKQANFHIVGIGASAGGLEALEKFFSKIPPDGDMAIFVIQHLSPE